jgi:hypothetical protein
VRCWRETKIPERKQLAVVRSYVDTLLILILKTLGRITVLEVETIVAGYTTFP